MRSLQILVVEDFKPFRQFVCSTLQPRTEFRIREALDGLEAVQKAEQLQPDLILLDIGLPQLNGIDVAKRLRKLAPDAKILFLTQESSPEVIREALNLGARGYVHKLSAHTDLLTAIEAVLRGEQFVSRSLSPPTSFIHEVAFYADDGAFAGDFGRFIETNLNSGNAVIMAVTGSHRRSILRNLQRNRLDIEACIRQGSFVPLDANETLSKFVVNDWPDSARLAKLLGDLVERTAKSRKEKHPRVAVCGELAPTLWVEGRTRAAIQVEHLWDEITRKFGVDTLCGYLSSSFRGDTAAQGFEGICAEHTGSFFR